MPREGEKKKKRKGVLGSQESSDKCISISPNWRGLDGGKIEANGKKEGGKKGKGYK